MNRYYQWLAIAGWGWSFFAASLFAGENYWPFWVKNDAEPFFSESQIQVGGPFVARKERAGGDVLSFRPIWTRYANFANNQYQTHVFYPLLNVKSDPGGNRGHMLNLLRWNSRDGEPFQLELFPFLFIREDEAGKTRALWPLGGTLFNRFGRDRIDFMAWPLYVRTLRDGERRDHLLYPFFSKLSGPEAKGWGLWPLWGQFEREGTYRHHWAFWPVYYNHVDDLEEAVPYRRFGVWPLYGRETGDGLKSETWIWPFFGYTEEFAPRPVYKERRYFWPFLVQGEGEEQTVERWLPFYAREKKPGYEEHWYVWPLLKTQSIESEGRIRERQTLFYFLYRDEKQTLVSGQARLNTLWPLWAYWNNGNGHRQLQLLDPLTVFFPANPVVKDNWSPLFAIIKFEDQSGMQRFSLLWDLFVFERTPETARKIELGPLFEWRSGKGWNVLKGLIGQERHEGKSKWRLFWNCSDTVAD